MACPFFEPRKVVSASEYTGARLPLLDEYEGLCHAAKIAQDAPETLRFRCCNHGYSRGTCAEFPVDEACSAIRFDVVDEREGILELLYVKEAEHTPLGWSRLRYSLSDGRTEPELDDVCARAQLRAFCESFTRRYGCA